MALFLEPVRNTLDYGQINVVLMALVAADCLIVAPRWPRGALVGIAAAVKLTPAAFVLFFLCRGDRRAAGTAAVSFAGCTAAGFLLAPHDSARYWTSIVFQTGRPGSPVYATNQSIQAVLGRAGLAPRTPAETAAWLVLSAAVLVAAWAGMRRAFAGAEDAWALSLNAFAALLISPISWSHHWVWGELAVLVLGLRSLRNRHRGGLAAAAAGLVIFAAAPQWWFPSGENRETHWAAWQQVLGSSYVIYAVVILLLAALERTAVGAPVIVGDQVGVVDARASLPPPRTGLDDGDVDGLLQYAGPAGTTRNFAVLAGCCRARRKHGPPGPLPARASPRRRPTASPRATSSPG